MNVGILTFPNSASYGAALQMYALYHTVEILGHTPEVINYKNSYMKQQKHVSTRIRFRRNMSNLLHFQMFRKFDLFERRNMIKYPGMQISNPQRLIEISKRYDAVICGSDQVWNPDITGGDLSYFLNFCDDNTKRVAYAPSFGLSEFSGEFSEAIRDDLEKFHALSVREEPGQSLISILLEKDVPLVCDPTLLMDANDWECLEKPHPAADGEYVFYYTVKTSSNMWNQCKAFAKERGLKIVTVGGNPLKKSIDQVENIQNVVDIDPGEWLYLLHHARYVFTNSFHGTAFSINYHKDFFVELSSLTNSRLTQILQMLGLSAQVVGVESLNGAAVDYSFADRVLPEIRSMSMNYLSDSLK